MTWNSGKRHVFHRFLRLCLQSAKMGRFDTTIVLYITSDFKMLSALMEKPVSISHILSSALVVRCSVVRFAIHIVFDSYNALGQYELNKRFLYYCFLNFIAEVKVSTPSPSVGTDSKTSASTLCRCQNTTFSHCLSMNSQNVSYSFAIC